MTKEEFSKMHFHKGTEIVLRPDSTREIVEVIGVRYDQDQIYYKSMAPVLSGRDFPHTLFSEFQYQKSPEEQRLDKIKLAIETCEEWIKNRVAPEPALVMGALKDIRRFVMEKST